MNELPNGSATYGEIETVGVCDTQAGEWASQPTEGAPLLLDWSDQAVGAFPPKTGDYADIHPHHYGLVAVHASHLPTREIIAFHGANDERVWPIGADAEVMNSRWFPVPEPVPQADPDLCSDDAYISDKCYVDIFCSGHVLLPDGKLLVAGGNVTSTPDGGGLVHTFTFDRKNAFPTLYPFGWERRGDMTVDRWYPTLTVLADGNVLISSGASREEPIPSNGQNTFELYNITTGLVTHLNNIQGDSPFSDAVPIPLYPFMFVLPNGDVLYAGGEEAPQGAYSGRVLIPNYNSPDQTTWRWHGREFVSTINGGSAVMYEPGKIMKSGGLRTSEQGKEDLAHNITETIDLAKFPSGVYPPYDPEDEGSAPDFVRRGDMKQPRHYHTLTLLADGRVIATGGNTRDNSRPGDHTANPCDYMSEPIGAMEKCNDEDRDGVPDDPEGIANGCPAVPSPCYSYPGDVHTCPLLGPDANCAVPDGNGGYDPSSILCGMPCTAMGGCPPGSTCQPGNRCGMPCPHSPNEICGAVVHCAGGDFCDPANNACHATLTAEIWDPACGDWTELGAQGKPRMYHSTALLLPDGNVISMGGGHRNLLEEQFSAQIFHPEYGLAGTVNAPAITVVSMTDIAGDSPALPYNGTAEVEFSNGGPGVVAGEFTLLRLGSVTHQFDMDQRFLRLGFSGDPDSANTLTVDGPDTSAHAPPGYYMLFLRTTDGEVSEGQYVKVGNFQSLVYVCEATSVLEVSETSCTMEPISGACPSGGSVENSVNLPLVDGPAGPVEGWHVLVPPGEIDDPLAPEADELAVLESRCVAACEAHWSGNSALAANCSDMGAFATPQHFYDGAAGSYDLVLAGQKHGEGIFAGQALACELDSNCCLEFDEMLCAAVPDRTTPASDLLGVGEEYRVALGTGSNVQFVTNQGAYTSPLTGSIGYSFCRDGSASAPCPFYLGSFEALATKSLTASVTCADGSLARLRLSNLIVKLSQPALGIAREGPTATEKGFPRGGLIFESAFDVGAQHVTSRRPSRADAVFSASGAAFSANNLNVELEVPCNASKATILAKFSVQNPADGSAIGRPPVVTNTTAVSGTCGVARALTAAVSDPDSDAGPVRWRVDGVLMAPGTSTMVVSATHTVEAVVRDGRGATRTAKKVVSCI